MNLKNTEKNDDSSLHFFTFSQKSKPLSKIEHLLHHLIPSATPLSLAKGEIFPLRLEKESARIFLLTKGIVSFCHHKSQRQICITFAPNVIGLTDCYASIYDVAGWHQHDIWAETACEGYSILHSDFRRIADEQALWHDIACILAQRLGALNAHADEIVGVDSYLKVRTLLIELWAYPAEFRQQITILNFIQRRTKLSKSRIMKILSELKKGDYIVINSGKLVGLKKLPDAY